MKKNIFIYGGLYKTATEFLAQNYFNKLDKNKFETFTFYKGSNQIFYHTFLKILYSNLSLESGKKIISDHISKIQKPNIIIQSAGFYAHRHNGHSDFNKRFEILEKIFDKPKYIVIIRNQSTSILSQWQAGIKKRVKISLKEYTNGEENFIKKQNILNCKEITNYKMFDYNLFLDPYINLSNKKIDKRAEFLVYEELKSQPNIFFKKLNNFIGIDELKFKINLNYHNKSNPLEETNLLGFIYFKKIHVLILTFIYQFYKIFKFFGFNLDIKPPYQNYKFEKTLNSFSMIYLNFLDKVIFKYFFKNKLKSYYYDKENRIEEISNFYKSKNIELDKKLGLGLNKFNYY